MKNDIEDRADVELMVDTFYGKVKESEILGFIFDDVAKVNWETHLPKMYNFWATMLLHERTFLGDPMSRHLELSERTEMSIVQYNEWLSLFHETVTDLFEGIKADEAKMRAERIARVMLSVIQGN
jgi:hemoglobin